MTDRIRRLDTGSLTRREFGRELTGLALSGLVSGRSALGAVSRCATPQSTPRPVPTSAQLAWQQDELSLFLHFGVNTFTDREWGDGHEDPAIFNPSALDARQWARAAHTAGFRMMILTAKHHDGFCLWPTSTTRHSVAASPFRNGTGDVVREFVDACRAERLRVGLYCSPWDRNSTVYGDSPRYNDLFCDQLTELLTRYGRIDEVWFDGANGEGPNGRRQTYDWPRFWSLVRRLQPNAVIFSDAGPDIRWIGNERGVAGDTNWSTMDPNAVPYPGADGAGVISALQHGDPSGSVWRPGETDVSIRPGWFYHPAEDAKVKTAGEITELYFTSVGRNSKLLLNVPPTRAGRLHETDVARLAAFRGNADDLLNAARDVTRGTVPRTRTAGNQVVLQMDLGRDRTVSISDLREQISDGQVVSGYTLEGATDASATAWVTLSRGTTIGYRKLDRFAPVRVRSLRLTIQTVAPLASPVEIRVYSPA
jgi:alpha-L-fucosidase